MDEIDQDELRELRAIKHWHDLMEDPEYHDAFVKATVLAKLAAENRRFIRRAEAKRDAQEAQRRRDMVADYERKFRQAKRNLERLRASLEGRALDLSDPTPAFENRSRQAYHALLTEEADVVRRAELLGEAQAAGGIADLSRMVAEQDHLNDYFSYEQFAKRLRESAESAKSAATVETNRYDLPAEAWHAHCEAEARAYEEGASRFEVLAAFDAQVVAELAQAREADERTYGTL